ncbi:MAG: hypothetical protein ABJE95_39210 [Byssovorax sp.]
MTLWKRTRTLAGASLLVALAACTTSAGGPVRELPADAREILARAPDVYAPSPGSMSAESAHLRATFEGALAPEARSMIGHDPALDLVAAVIAQTFSDNQQLPTKALIQWLFWRCGATSLYSHTRPSWAFGGNQVQERMDGYAIASAHTTRPLLPTSYGVARFTQGTKTSQAIVFGRASLDVGTFQKRYAPGAPLVLHIRPLDASTEFVLFTDTGDGGVTREPMQKHDDGSFFISRSAPSRPGRYFLEIRARGPRSLAADPGLPWERSLLWAPIYVGVPEPMVPDERLRVAAPTPADPLAWPAWIAGQYNAERGKLGNPPLTLDPRLTTMAQERSAALAAVDFEPPPDRQLAQKLTAAGFPVARHDESFAPVESPSDYVYMQMLRPSARKRLFLAERLLVGIGVAARAAEPSGRPSYDEVEYAVLP